MERTSYLGSSANRAGPSLESLPNVEQASIEELFWFRVDPIQSSPHYLKDCLFKVSKHHKGHGDIRPEGSLEAVADYVFDLGVHDLQGFSDQSARLTTDSVNVLDAKEQSVLRDMTSIVLTVRHWCVTRTTSSGQRLGASPKAPSPAS